MIDLPPLGLGCAGLGNLYRAVSDEVAAATLAAALDAGIGFFDVAPHYGFGLAEERLGRALEGRTAIVSTKVGRLLAPVAAGAGERHGFVDALPNEPVFDYTRDGVMRSVSASLARLRRPAVDILFAHDLGTRTHGAAAERHWRDFLDGGYRALADLRDAGVTRAIGLGVNEIAACDRMLDEAPVDVILLAGRYTLLEPDAALPLLERCRALGTRVVIGGPYNSGVLAEGASRSSHFDYGAPPADVLARVGELERTCARFGTPLPAAALQFPLRHPAVASVIPGMVGRGQVAASLRFLDLPVPLPLWAACRPDMGSAAA